MTIIAASRAQETMNAAQLSKLRKALNEASRRRVIPPRHVIMMTQVMRYPICETYRPAPQAAHNARSTTAKKPIHATVKRETANRSDKNTRQITAKTRRMHNPIKGASVHSGEEAPTGLTKASNISTPFRPSWGVPAPRN